jgi:hypothetical protein
MQNRNLHTTTVRKVKNIVSRLLSRPVTGLGNRLATVLCNRQELLRKKCPVMRISFAQLQRGPDSALLLLGV